MDIATLIPAYKKEYIADTITSCLNQTLKPRLLLISDDSADDKIFDFFSTHSQLSNLCHQRQIKLQIVKGPKQGPLANIINLLKIWNTSTNFFHILMDDDIICPNFYEQHSKSRSKDDISCTVSKRWLAGTNNLPYLSPHIPELIQLDNSRLQSISLKKLSATIFPQCLNWLGEFSNATFHSSFAKDIISARVLNKNIFGLLDIGMFLGAAADNKLYFVNEHLSLFRVHEKQNTNIVNPNLFFGHSDWLNLAKICLDLELLNEPGFWKVFDKIFLNQLTSKRDQFCQYPELLVFYKHLDALNQSRDISHFFHSWSDEMQRWLETKLNFKSTKNSEIQMGPEHGELSGLVSQNIASA